MAKNILFRYFNTTSPNTGEINMINAVSFGRTEYSNNNKKHAAYAAGGAVIGAAAGGLAGANKVKLMNDFGEVSDKFFSTVINKENKTYQKMTQETFDKIKQSQEFISSYGPDYTLEELKKTSSNSLELLKMPKLTEKNKQKIIDIFKNFTDEDVSNRTLEELQSTLDFNKYYLNDQFKANALDLVDAEKNKIKSVPEKASEYVKLNFDIAKKAVKEMKMKSAAKYGAAAAAILGLAGLSISALKNKD